MNKSEPPRPESVAQLSKRVFIELHLAICGHEDGVRNGNVESVHDMRVAIRRLRVALSNFAACVPVETRRGLKTQLENLARRLGGVRDLDVMIAAMESILLVRPQGEQRTISNLIKRLKSRRRFRMRQLAEYLDGKEYAALKQHSPGDLYEEAQEEQRQHGQAA